MTVSMVNRHFGRLTVINNAGYTNDHHKKWLCKCTCGNTTIVDGRDLRKGATKSCGCLLKEKAANRIVKMNTIHNNSHSRLYNIWVGMRDRCRRQKNWAYKYYGGRGISVCKEWDSYLEFKKWALQNGYEENLTIDRINVNDNYKPSNCRWITIQEQQRNKRNNKKDIANR